MLQNSENHQNLANRAVFTIILIAAFETKNVQSAVPDRIFPFFFIFWGEKIEFFDLSFDDFSNVLQNSENHQNLANCAVFTIILMASLETKNVHSPVLDPLLV